MSYEIPHFQGIEILQCDGFILIFSLVQDESLMAFKDLVVAVHHQVMVFPSAM